MKKIIGYTTGVFDMFHTGHLNILRNSKSMCDLLIVGVSTDELAEYKGKKPIVEYEDRAEIVRNIKYVDLVVPQKDMDKLSACKKLNVDILFVGDDWFGTEKWNLIEADLSKENIKVIYFPYTNGISSTALLEKLDNIENK